MKRRKTTTTQEEPLLLTIDEARSLLQYGRDTMRGLIESGAIQTIRVGRTVRISRQAIMNFIEAQTSAQAG